MLPAVTASAAVDGAASHSLDLLYRARAAIHGNEVTEEQRRNNDSYGDARRMSFTNALNPLSSLITFVQSRSLVSLLLNSMKMQDMTGQVLRRPIYLKV